MATIYEIADKYKFIQQMIEDGTDPAIFAEALAGIDGEAGEKLESYAMVLKNAESDITGVDAEIKRLQERKKAMQNNVSRMKDNMSILLQEIEGNRLKTDKFTFSFRKSTAVQIDDISLIPNDFIKTETSPMKVDIKKALASGEVIPGASLVENQSLSIR